MTKENLFWISWMVMMARMMSLMPVMAPLQIVATLTTISLRSSAASALPAISMIRTSLARLLLRATMRAHLALVASFSHDFAYEQDGTAAGDAGNFVVDWDDGSECQRDVPAADFRKNVRLSYYKHA